MAVIHFLNVKEGDCAWIKHPSGRNTVIDISNGKPEDVVTEKDSRYAIFESAQGNYNQKAHPVDPIKELKDGGVTNIFRFILTHPDMDHMDGIKALFEEFEVNNFWDTANDKEMKSDANWGRYNEEDWTFYQSIRHSLSAPTTLNLYAGSIGQYYNRGGQEETGGDGLYILVPTEELVEEANRSGDYNDCSYVILYKINGKKIIFGGDSGEKTWNYILENYEDEVTNIDILLAPHHGRKTGGNREYLDVLRPKLTLFGNAKSKYLDYADWYNRKLDYITNNQANCIILDTDGFNNGIEVYVTYEKFARARNKLTVFSDTHKAWYIKTV